MPSEVERRKLNKFLTSEEGQDWTLRTIQEAAQVKKKASMVCPNCGKHNYVEVLDANAAVNAVKTAHEWGLTKPKDDGDSTPKVARLRDLTPKQRDKLREVLYTRLSGELDAVEIKPTT